MFFKYYSNWLLSTFSQNRDNIAVKQLLFNIRIVKQNMEKEPKGGGGRFF